MEHVELTLPRVPVSVARARAGLRPLREELGHRYQDAVLLASELATNAIRHGQGPTVTLIARMRGTKCRIEVIDGGSGFVPMPAPVVTTGMSGRGLPIVAELADAWGVYEGNSTHVWFEIDMAARPA
jgi:anti-sigma regulatory factor (Ser/Thr protein kinase)